MKWFIVCKSTRCLLSPEVDSVSELESWWTSGRDLGYRMTLCCRRATLVERIMAGSPEKSSSREWAEMSRLWGKQIQGQSRSYQWGF